MPFVFEGKTKCAICGQPILDLNEAVGFQAFLRPEHRLYRFFDAVLHLTCFLSCPEHDEVEAVYRRFQEIWDGRPRNLKTREEIEAWGKEAFRDFDKDSKE